MWSQTVVDRRAEAAAVKAMASGSQHRTMRAISQGDITELNDDGRGVEKPRASHAALAGRQNVSSCRRMRPIDA
jgi:hypothetical protein